MGTSITNKNRSMREWARDGLAMCASALSINQYKTFSLNQRTPQTASHKFSFIFPFLSLQYINITFIFIYGRMPLIEIPSEMEVNIAYTVRTA